MASGHLEALDCRWVDQNLLNRLSAARGDVVAPEQPGQLVVLDSVGRPDQVGPGRAEIRSRSRTNLANWPARSSLLPGHARPYLQRHLDCRFAWTKLMVIVKALVGGVVLILLGLTASTFLLIGAVASVFANSGVTGVGFSEEALEDIPPAFVAAYLAAAALCPGLPAPVIAGIGKVESNHGRHGGSSVGTDGVVRPPIIGIPLDGRPGVALILDTDNGRLDGDRTFDRASGTLPVHPFDLGVVRASRRRPAESTLRTGCHPGGRLASLS